MSNKSTLSLIEQVIMILVFSVAAAICLKVFVYSDSLSKNSEMTAEAYRIAQSAAEEVKNSFGEIPGGLPCEREEDGLVLRILPEETGSEYLGGATVSVFSGGSELCSLPVRWQR